MKKIILVLILQFSALLAIASPLKPVKLDNPRDTMKSYLSAMRDYVKGQKTANKELENRIFDATRTLDLSDIAPLLRRDKGKELAILLKEVIDRVIIVDLDKVPEDSNISKWRLKDTEIIIRKIESGDSKGNYVFSKMTVERIPEFYNRVKHLPYVSPKYQGAGYTPPLGQDWLPEWAKEDFWGLKKMQWLGIFLAIVLGLFLKKISEFVLSLFLKLLDEKQDSLRFKVLHAVEKPFGLIVASAVWYFFVHFLAFEGTVQSLLFGATQVTFSISIIWAIYRLTDLLTDYLHKVANKTESELDDHLVPLFSKSLRVFIVVIGFLVMIQNLGFNVMSLLAGLGLGGLAFALAAKDTAANLFGSIMILLDRPFKIGDWIVTSNAEGNVEEVGFRSTRIRTFYNSVISIPNSIMANEKIDNMGQRNFRRTKAVLGLTYDTTPEKLEAFIEGVKNIIEANPKTRKEGYHVAFNGYGDFSLNVLVYFFLAVDDWGQEMMNRQYVYLEILRLAKEIDVQFAFPTQSLFVEAFPEKEALRKEQDFTNKDLQAKAKAFGPNAQNSAPTGRGIFEPPY